MQPSIVFAQDNNTYEELAEDNDIQKFAREIKERAEGDGDGSIFLRVWFAMGLQVGLFIALLIRCTMPREALLSHSSAEYVH